MISNLNIKTNIGDMQKFNVRIHGMYVLLTVELYHTLMYTVSLSHTNIHTSCSHACTLSHAFTYTSSYTNVETLSYTYTSSVMPWLKVKSSLSAYHQREIQLLSETGSTTNVRYQGGESTFTPLQLFGFLFHYMTHWKM